MRSKRFLALVAFIFLLPKCSTLAAPDAAPADTTPAPMTLDVDASDFPRRILHARLVVPATPGPMKLLYPKWIPGEHGPTGPVENLAGIQISAAGKPVPWRRDDADMYAIGCEVPAGADAIEVSLDFLLSKSKTFTGGA